MQLETGSTCNPLPSDDIGEPHPSHTCAVHRLRPPLRTGDVGGGLLIEALPLPSLVLELVNVKGLRKGPAGPRSSVSDGGRRHQAEAPRRGPAPRAAGGGTQSIARLRARLREQSPER